VYVADKAIQKREYLNLSYPIEKGIIQNFDQMERIWHHTFHNELRMSPEEKRLIMNEEPGNTKEKREKTTEIMFEMFNVPGFYLEQSSVLTMFASGRTTGVVLNMGHTKNDVCCIHEGNILPVSEISHLGGRDLTKFLQKSLLESGYNLGVHPYTITESAKRIKEKLCFIRNSNDLGKGVYKLPDGNMVTLEKERYLATEMLFNKYNEPGDELSIQEIVSTCIKSRDDEIREELYKNIILSGGGSMFKGITERLMNELKFYHSKEIKISDPPTRDYSNFSGASILASMSSLESKWIKTEHYHEFGPHVINNVCTNIVEANHQLRQPNELSGKITKMLKESKLTDLNIQ
jgi:actin, other eukaryote